MNAIKDGGPAFPQHLIETRDGAIQASYDAVDGAGLSLRDYFAGQMLMGVYASGSHRGVVGAIAEDAGLPATEIGHIAEARIADMCYALADAMLQARQS